MACLNLHLLGPFQLTLDGEPLDSMRSDKVRALLAYLAIESGQPHRREKLAGLLWPDYPEKSARASLRRALADLRKAIRDDQADPPYLQITRQTIRFDQDSQARIDVNLFTSLSKSNQPSETQAIPAWQEAADLYQGEFMEGFSLPDSPTFEEWLRLTREHLRLLLLENLQQLTGALETRGDYEAALPYARRQVELEPLSENAQRQLMRLLALNGQREAALSLYQTCSDSLTSELGVAPSDETIQLYEAILAGELLPPTHEPSATTKTEIPPNPYRGLFAFREVDAPFFFGREIFVDQLLDAVDRLLLVALIGCSGSGKSSVVFAGLAAQLHQDHDWQIAAFRPGNDPFQAIAAVLMPLLESDLSQIDQLVETRKLASALYDGELPLIDVAERILTIHPGSGHLLLVCDQFEELYTLCTEDEHRTRFIDLLLSAVDAQAISKEACLRVVLTLRADFLEPALRYRAFADALQGSDIKLGSMTHQEMAKAIEKPAQVQAVTFESGLVERILEDVNDQPGDLPLLQFALTNLWDLQQDGKLTHAAYEDIGRVESALACHAEEVFSALDSEQQESARKIFVQLVKPGESTQDTRRLATRSELGESNWEVVQKLADARLVVTGQSLEAQQTVEVVHESLIQGWERLRHWLQTDRTFRIWQERLRAALRQWQTTDNDEGALLRGAPLAEAEVWLAERDPDISGTEHEFIQASLDFREHQQANRERSRRRLLTGLSIGLLITIFLAVFAGWQWRQAETQRFSAVQAQATAAAERDQTRIALSGLLAAQSHRLLDEEYDLALLLSVESVRRADIIEARDSLFAALSHSPNLAKFLYGHQDDVRSLAFQPGGSLLASGSQDGQIILWDIDTGQPLAQPLTGHQAQVYGLSFSPDGKLLASGGFDEMVFLWDVDPASADFGQPLGAPLAGHNGNVWSVAFSPDGRLLASAGADRKILLWDVKPGSSSFGETIASALSGHEGLITSLSFNPEGDILASGSADKTIILWDVETGEELSPPLTGHTSFVSSVAFSPDGRSLASGSKDNTIRLWDVDPSSQSFGDPLSQPLTGHTDNIWGLAFNPKDDSLVSSGEDGLILVWDVDPESVFYGQPSESHLAGHSGPICDIAFSPDGEKIATAGKDQAVLLWNETSDNPVTAELEMGSDPGWELAFSPDRKVLAWTDLDGTIYLWNIDQNSSTFGQPLGVPLVGHLDMVNGLSFSPDGKMLASGSDDQTIRLWDVDEASTSFGQPIGSPLTGHPGHVIPVEFSPDGKILASGDDHGEIRLWNVIDGSIMFGQQIYPPLDAHEGFVSTLRFNPDGNILASAGKDGIVRLWNLFNGSESINQQLGPSLTGYKGYVFIQFSPDGRTLAASYEDNTIRIWDVDQESELFGRQIGPPLNQYLLDYSPDGLYLTSGDSAGKIKLWDMTTDKAMEISIPGEMEELTGPDVPIYGLSFSPDGRTLVAVLNDSRIVLWDFDIKSLQTRACQRANRNLTREEWQRFFGDEPYRATCPDLPVD